MDLGFQTDVHKVRIHNRCDVTNTGEQLWKRLQNFTIHVSHTEPFITGKLDPALNDTTLCYSHQGYQVQRSRSPAPCSSLPATAVLGM